MSSPVFSHPVGPEEAARNRLTGQRRWMLGALLAQLFLVSIYVSIITSDLPSSTKAWSLAVLLTFSAVYVFVVGRSRSHPIGVRIAVVVGLLVLTVPMFFVMGTSASALWIFVGVAGGLLFPGRVALGLGVLLAGAMLLVDLLAGDPLSWELALTLVALTAFMVGFAGNVRLNIELRQTREQLAVAAVAAERERIGRDLHDILGHSLTAIAVKAGLARRLMDRDPVAAASEIGDVERLAREALADVRATASGIRGVSLAGELAVAGSVLRAAGIVAHLPQAVDDVDPSAREVLGYVVREAVTNVVRHAHARSCTITLGPGSVEIVDDGVAVSPAGTDGARPDRLGSGLAGLADRITARGGRFHAGPRLGGGFAVRATVPATVSGAPSAGVQPLALGREST